MFAKEREIERESESESESEGDMDTFKPLKNPTNKHYKAERSKNQIKNEQHQTEIIQ